MSGSTPLASAMWGCWPKYWVTSSRARSRAFAPVPVDAADDELGPVDVVQRAARFGGAFRQQVEGFLVVGGGDQSS